MVLISNNGTGKSHLAICLGREACRQGKRVSFQTANGLVTSLIEASEEKRLLNLQRRLKAFESFNYKTPIQYLEEQKDVTPQRIVI